MIRKLCFLLAALVAVTTLASASVAAARYRSPEPWQGPIGDLLRDSPQHDGQVVVVEGEVLGDVLNRGEMAWVNIGDGTGAIGVWTAAADLQDIVPGRHGMTGDRIRVTGTFYRSATEMGGDTAIRAQAWQLTVPHSPQERPLTPLRAAFAVVALALAGVMFMLWRRRSRAVPTA